MSFFFPNIKDMSDEDILNKLLDLRKKKIYAATYMRTSQALNQIMDMEAELLAVHSERMFMKSWEESKELANKPIETDPGMAKNEQTDKGRKHSGSKDSTGEGKEVGAIRKAWSKKFSSQGTTSKPDVKDDPSKK